MNIKKFFFLTVFLFCCSLFSRDIGADLCKNAGEIWNLKPAQLLKKYNSQKAFKWKSPLKKKMVYHSNSAQADLEFMKYRVVSGNFCFGNNKKLRGINLYLATPENINDTKKYSGLIKDLKKQIEQIGKLSTPRLRKRKSGSKYHFTYSWKSKEYYASLSWNYVLASGKFIPGKAKVSIFARVAFTEPAPAQEEDEKSKASGNPKDDNNDTPNDKKEGPLKKNDKGDLSLKIPLAKTKLNQSSAAACVKSLLLFKKYPIKRLDWKKINERLDINVKSAKGAGRIYSRISQECNCKVKRLASSSIFDDFDTRTRFIRDYNREALKAGKPRIDSFRDKVFSKLLMVMNEDILAKVRNKNNEAEKFKSKVIKELEKGNPIIWVVFLGVVKEKPRPPVSQAVHVRLITGFSTKENSLIYADCWGKGHASKKMSWEKGWGITLEAMVATPKD